MGWRKRGWACQGGVVHAQPYGSIIVVIIEFARLFLRYAC